MNKNKNNNKSESNKNNHLNEYKIIKRNRKQDTQN